MSMRNLAAIIFFAISSMAAGHQRSMRGAATQAQEPAAGSSLPVAGSPAAGSSDAPSSIDTTSVETEIKNINYYDLTKTWKDPSDEVSEDAGQPENPNDWMMDMNKNNKQKKGKPSNKPPKDGSDASEKTEEPFSPEGGPSADPIGEMLGGSPSNPETDGPLDDSSIGSSTQNEGPTDDSPDESGGVGGPENENLLQVSSGQTVSRVAVTVQSKLKSAIESGIEECLPCQGGQNYSPAPAPAPSPAPAALQRPLPPSGMLPSAVALASIGASQPQAPAAAPRQLWAGAAPARFAPAGGPAAAQPASTCPKVHVALSPGSKMKKSHLLNSAPIHATTLIKVTMFERAGNGLNDMQGVQNHLNQALASGELKSKIAAAIHGVTGVKPKLADIEVKTRAVKLWDHQQCGSHMSKLVKSLTRDYTKRQVPIALYNECTNFMTKISFSHDYVLDRRDATRCRKATRKFALQWKLGKNLGPKAFEPMCHNFCEAKFGDDAAQCSFENK